MEQTDYSYRFVIVFGDDDTQRVRAWQKSRELALEDAVSILSRQLNHNAVNKVNFPVRSVCVERIESVTHREFLFRLPG